jgi:hypothetical protein
MADLLAIRALVDAYAHCADRRDAAGQMAPLHRGYALCRLHGRDICDANAGGRGPRRPRAPIFDNLNIYKATTHFNGQSTVELDGDLASGVSYCLAHHVSEAGGQATLMIASVRYLDQFSRVAGAWRFAERRLYVDWTETRLLISQA